MNRVERLPMNALQSISLRRCALTLAFAMLACAAASAQTGHMDMDRHADGHHATFESREHHAPPPPPGPGMPVITTPGSATGQTPGLPRRPLGGPSTQSQQSGSVQLGPGGRWWDDKHAAHSIGLKPEQQHKMDAVFNAQKAQLYNTYTVLKQQEAVLSKLQRASSPDKAALLAQIDKVTALRGELAKQSTALALALRDQLTPDQVKQMEAGD